MKTKMKSINILGMTLAMLTMLASCSEDFLTRAPKDQLVDANFYQTDDQILAGTAPLYSAAWKDYIDQANYKIGDMRGGTLFTPWAYSDNRDFCVFNVTGITLGNTNAYRAFYQVVGQANTAINNINTYAGAKVSKEIKNYAIAEARFMRATAYTYLVLNYGPVPIIQNNVDHLNSPTLKRNTEASIWKFIKNDYLFAAKYLVGTTPTTQPGRLSSWSAEGMLARTYLTMAGFGKTPGNLDQTYLDSAKYYADRVIRLSGKKLLDNYADLFKFGNDNNNESLFELEWVYASSNYSYLYANTMVSQITYDNSIAANGDGWGGSLSATSWMLSQYDGLYVNNGAAFGSTLDKRLKPTFMLPGFTYPELIQSTTNKPLTFPYNSNTTSVPEEGNGFNYASVKKYVIGKQVTSDGLQTDKQDYPNDTYMLRLAEMYLIYAEAAVGNSGSTSDPTALQYFNAIRHRAGLPDMPGPINWDAVFKERVKEFAMENMTWYDLVRLHYYDPNKAYSILNNQDRGLFLVKPDQMPNATAWTFSKTSWFTNANGNIDFVSASDANFMLPIPQVELAQAPALNEEPVDVLQ